MTEEKENCNFQQNYNVFGLDDKPCCYLYHKYCEEIDNCYFKRCKRLEQENKELKEIINKSAKSFCNDYLKTFEENKFLNKQIMEVKFNAQQEIEFLTEENNGYRSALEEIRDYVQNQVKHYESVEHIEAMCDWQDVLDKINEVLQ